MGSMNQAWSKSLSFGGSVFNVYLTCDTGIMLQLDAKDVLRVREIGGFRVLTKAPETVRMVCAIAVLAVAMWLYTNFDSDTL
jgi:hypothetical protein